ncbi:MAG: NADH-quinone oxidoreductase subunit L [Thermofilaceae archaeon]
MFVLVNAVWALPVIAAILIPLLAKVDGRLRDVSMVAVGLIVAALTSFLAASGPIGSLSVEWVKVPGIGNLSFSLLVDGLSLTFMNIVSWVSLAVLVYSVSYMSGDPGVTRYYLLLMLFLGSMELLVLSGDILLLFFCWEIVSICSFLLISYWYQDSESSRLTQWVGEPPEEYTPSHCGLKAFLTTRFADAFMIVGVIIMVTATGSSSIMKLCSGAPSAVRDALLLSLVLMAIGAMGKSAQVPFLEWLPDAMAGPSGVSALMHAATMVKAGVYLVARLSQLALAWSSAVDARLFFYLVTWSGAITSLLAALQASTTSELKKTLAYSTASQIGYMMAALGTSWYYGGRAVPAAVMHAVSHAFFKSSLFLAAGVVIHAEGSRFYKDLFCSNGKHKLAYAAMLLSAFSLIGIPPFAGYWSKERVLLLLSRYSILFTLTLLTTAITAFYTVRMLMLLARGKQCEDRSDAPLEIIPCLMLALTGLTLGVFFGLTFNESVPSQQIFTSALSLASAAIGTATAFLVYRGHVVAPLPTIVLKVLKRRFYINALYYYISNCTLSLAEAARVFEDSYNRVIKLSVRFFVEGFSKVARVQVGVINLRELLWILALLALLSLFLAGGR